MKLFVYNVVFSSVADGSSVTTTLTLGSDADFKLSEIRTTGTSKARVQIKETSGNQFSNSPFDAAVIGSGNNGFKVLEDVTLAKGTQLDITLTNNSGGTIAASAFEVDFIGYKL